MDSTALANFKRLTSTSAASTTSGLDTPTNTTEIGENDDRSVCTCLVSATPTAGRCYIIRSQTDGRVIRLLNGSVSLSKQSSRSLDGQRWDLRTCGGMVWDCIETDGFLGFRNPISGTFLGYHASKRGMLHADVKHHKGHEYFVARKRADGGFGLWMMENGWRMEPVGVDNRDKEALKRNGETTIVWEFEEVRF